MTILNGRNWEEEEEETCSKHISDPTGQIYVSRQKNNFVQFDTHSAGPITSARGGNPSPWEL